MLALIAPHFGSREIFLAALLGIILVVLAHRGQIFAAGMLAAFGIFLHTVGLEPVKYNPPVSPLSKAGWLPVST